jgi:hypothetical protein
VSSSLHTCKLCVLLISSSNNSWVAKFLSHGSQWKIRFFIVGLLKHLEAGSIGYKIVLEIGTYCWWGLHTDPFEHKLYTIIDYQHENSKVVMGLTIYNFLYLTFCIIVNLASLIAWLTSNRLILNARWFCSVISFW